MMTIYDDFSILIPENNQFNPFMHNVVKWRNIFKVCLAILQHYTWNG